MCPPCIGGAHTGAPLQKHFHIKRSILFFRSIDEILRSIRFLRMTGKSTFAEVSDWYQSISKNLVDRRITPVNNRAPSGDRMVGSKR